MTGIKSEHRLRPKQKEFLLCLREAGKALPKAILCERTDSHPTNVWANAIGPSDPESREKRERENGYLSLISLGYISTSVVDVDGKEEVLYKITKEGVKALKEQVG